MWFIRKKEQLNKTNMFTKTIIPNQVKTSNVINPKNVKHLVLRPTICVSLCKRHSGDKNKKQTKPQPRSSFQKKKTKKKSKHQTNQTPKNTRRKELKPRTNQTKHKPDINQTKTQTSGCGSKKDNYFKNPNSKRKK